ncbi:DUF3618 domain-containing protein [Mesorhizobium sp. M3A.F.Ca.ET.201.01.1.1]|nr:DUF3618 domain-containing protein [Mesorhizobium sp. M3A.F.Ca.ET.201.01.1.1]
MSDKSAAELEREAEAARARVVDTADSIRDKMTPGQLFDEFTELFAGGDSQMLRNLKAQMRDNPLPLAVVGAGLAWLMLGSGPSAASTGYAAPRNPGQPEGASGSGVGGMISDAAGSVTAAASGAADTISGMASSASESVASSVAGAGSATSDMAARASRSAQELLQNQPLAAAAVGLAVGTAIGVMLPHTAVEDEQLGGYREKLRDTAEATLEEGLDAAKEVAAEAYRTASDEAWRQASGEGTLADKVSEVVRSAADKADEAVRERFSNSDPPPQKT